MYKSSAALPYGANELEATGPIDFEFLGGAVAADRGVPASLECAEWGTNRRQSAHHRTR